MMNFAKVLSGGDLRSVGKGALVIAEITNQKKFDQLVKLLHHPDRLVVMRASDAIEKITQHNSAYLNKHKTDLLELLRTSENKELKWHLAQLIPRLTLRSAEFNRAWNTLIGWAIDPRNSRIVRVSAMQSLFLMALRHEELMKDFLKLAAKLEKENIPSINARIRSIRKELKATS